MATKKVKTTERGWREEVKRADPTPEDKTVYRFSNGRKFKDKRDPYAN